MALVNVSLDDIVAMKKAAEALRSPPSSTSGSGRGSRRSTLTTTSMQRAAAANNAVKVEKTPKVVVSNVSGSVSEEELERLFETFGRVVTLGPVNREIATTEVRRKKIRKRKKFGDFARKSIHSFIHRFIH